MGDDVKAVAERLIRSHEAYVAERGNPRITPNLSTDAYTVARAYLADLADAERQIGELRTALETIRRNYGKVCENYELCRHVACDSSVGAWMEADAALARGAVAGGAGDGETG